MTVTVRPFQKLVGRTIIDIRYMSEKEKSMFDWYGDALVFTLDNGQGFVTSSDQEGNNGGWIELVDLGSK